MTRLFGCLSNQPQRLGEALASVRSALVAKGPIARWGVGYVQSGEVLLAHHPRAVPDELDFYPVVSGLASDYVIGAADLDDGLRGHANAQPFRFRRWMFAQDLRLGDAPEGALEAAATELAAAIPDFLRRNLRGNSIAERAFFHVLAALHDDRTIDAPDLDPRRLRAALREALGRLLPIGTRHGLDLGGNLIATNGRAMIAARLGGPLYLRLLKQQTDLRRPESQFRSVLLVSADASPGEGFEAAPPRSTVTIGRDVSTDVASLDG
jgi:hypothetical protein